jgi:hypothetical protein
VIGDRFAFGIPISVLELISVGIKEFSKKDNNKIEFFGSFCDVITFGFLMKSMKTWTNLDTFLDNLDKFGHFRCLPNLRLLIQFF